MNEYSVVQFLFVFTLVDHTAITLGEYVYPGWADGIGWLMFAMVVVTIPLIAIIEIVRARRAHPFLSITVGHTYTRLLSLPEDGPRNIHITSFISLISNTGWAKKPDYFWDL